jgi:hypothetical protein
MMIIGAKTYHPLPVRARTFTLRVAASLINALKGIPTELMMIDLCTYLTPFGRRAAPLMGAAGRIALESAVRRMRAP